MRIENLFQKAIRPINGVVKADQLDAFSVWNWTSSWSRGNSTNTCERSSQPMVRPSITAMILMSRGRSASGFQGSSAPGSRTSSKLSYLLQNGTHMHDGQGKQAVEFFESKIKDIKRRGLEGRRDPLQHRQQGRHKGWS